jgi:hypothetical protein
MTTPSTPTTWAERVHEHHVRLGIVMAGCPGCREIDAQRPEWLRRLVAKDMTGVRS